MTLVKDNFRSLHKKNQMEFWKKEVTFRETRNVLEGRVKVIFIEGKDTQKNLS